MKVSEGIIELLKKNGRITVPGFGVFYTENTRAQLKADQKTLLPPAKEIRFEADYDAQDPVLADFLAANQNANAVSDLKSETDYWKNLLVNNDSFKIDSVGEFFVSDNQLVFKGERIQTQSPDFYGLEEINLAEIKSGETGTSHAQEEEDSTAYTFNKSILWLFLLVIPVAGLAYLGITQKERLFGKKSFDDLSVKNSTHRIEKKEPIPVDSAKIKAAADSLGKDSIAKAAVAVPKTTKKWSSKKQWSSKKYKNKKWKPKKRQTR